MTQGTCTRGEKVKSKVTLIVGNVTKLKKARSSFSVRLLEMFQDWLVVFQISIDFNISTPMPPASPPIDIKVGLLPKVMIPIP